MRTWLLTNTTYGSWFPGDSRGSVKSVRKPSSNTRIEHDVPGEPYEEAMPALREAAIAQMNGPPIYFDVEKADLVAKQFLETATYRGWTILAIAVMYNHFHIVVEVPGNPKPGKILGDFKAYGTRCLNKKYGVPLSKTWWTDDGSKRILRDETAVMAAIHYVLYKQPNPLVLWSPEGIEIAKPPAADAGRLAR